MNVHNVPVFHYMLCKQLEAICNIISLNIEYSSLLFGSVLGKNFYLVLNSLLSSNCSNDIHSFFCADKSFSLHQDLSWDNHTETTVLRVHHFKDVPLTKVVHLLQNGANGQQSDESCNHKFQARKSRVYLAFHWFAPAPFHRKRSMSMCILQTGTGNVP